MGFRAGTYLRPGFVNLLIFIYLSPPSHYSIHAEFTAIVYCNLTIQSSYSLVIDQSANIIVEESNTFDPRTPFLRPGYLISILFSI